MNLSRRTFIFVGVAGAAALVAARWLPRPRESASALGTDGMTVMTAVVPVLLSDALPPAGEARDTALRDTLAALDGAIAGLSPRARSELADLFALLVLPPARWSLAHTRATWSEVTAADVGAFLARLRDSRIGLLRAAYDALHQLVMAAWYGNPQAWAAIGYPGPPVLG